jgi:2-succinyl-5-enolpyruvyl-6-hydroxy-3-cyclohexene-1-carboxylate synthase
MPSSHPATEFSVALLGEFIGHGIRHLVLCPGSRSQALALAAAEFERAGLLTLHVRIDERAAGFLALGLAVETRMPVLVVTTSGTAVANLHPAALEARHSGVPLILLTADRPLELRGIASNQTTDQPGIFGHAVEWVRDVEAPSHGGFDADAVAQLAAEAVLATGHNSTPGPVQLNLAFREPLSGPVGTLPEIRPVARPAVARDEVLAGGDAFGEQHRAGADRRNLLDQRPGTVVIAGHAAGPRAESTARALGAPLLAEVSSGARFGPNLVVAYRELLNDDEFGGRVERVIVFGHPTLTREVPALIQRDGVETIVVRGPSTVDYNPGHRVSRFLDSVRVDAPADDSREARAWLGSWVHASRAILDAAEPEDVVIPEHMSAGEYARRQLEVFRTPVTRRMLVNAVWRATWPHDRLVIGASRLIREADVVVPGKRIPVHANRGLAGIDGTISTGMGIAFASQFAAAAHAGTPGVVRDHEPTESGDAPRSTGEAAAATGGAEGGVTRVLIGDLTLLHDAGSLLLGHGERHPRIQVIVGNDGGGTIFDGLEVAQSAASEQFDRVQYTPQSVQLQPLAEAYGWRYLLASTRGELDEALAASAGPTLIEVPLPR